MKPLAGPVSGVPKLPPLFRRIDWLTLIATTLLVFIGYYLTLAPELTLEDSGELATGSFYAGIPHPPGYPVWTIYTHIWSLLPVGNVAWRVAMGEALAGALACGLLAFMVSRGSSMFMESIIGLKDIDRRWESAICIVSGFIAGTLLGFNGFMWSQSVIVEVYSFGVLSLMGTLCSLLRWVYAPHQRRYLYLAFFIFGICFTNHQTLILATMGLEVAVIAVDQRIGRDLLMMNSIVFVLGYIATKMHMTKLDGDPGMWLIYNGVGYASLIGFFVLTFLTRKTAEHWIALGRDFLYLVSFGYVIVLLGFVTEILPPLDMHSPTFLVFHFIGLAALGLCSWLAWFRSKREIPVRKGVHVPLLVLSTLFILFLMPVSANLFGFVKSSLSSFWAWVTPAIIVLVAYLLMTGRKTEVRIALVIGVMWLFGAGFYLYMPIAGMTCPPMQWGYPRTLEGFIHALTRGQYENAHPTNILHDPLRFLDLIDIVRMGVGAEFTWVYTFIALVPFLFFLRLQRRERAWLIGLSAVYLFLAVLLSIMLNPTRDRQSMELNRVFFTASHSIIAMFVGYGVTLIMATLLAARESLWRWLPLAALFLGVAALDKLATAAFEMSGTDLSADGIGQIIWGFVWLAAILLLLLNYRPEKVWIPVAACVCGVAGLYQIGFGIRDMVISKANVFACTKVVLRCLVEKIRYNDPTLQIYGALLVVGIVAAGLFLIWTGRQKLHLSWLLALAAMMPLYSVMSNWADNEERGHWFGYWFGHDMFTPPFIGPDGKFGAYDPKLREQALKGPNASLVYPEMTRDAILFGGTDPGRFCPTYMIFCDSFIPDKCKPIYDQRFDRRDVYIITQNALADQTYLEYIRSQYFRSDQYKYDTPFFLDALQPKRDKNQNYSTNFLAALAYNVLDVPLTRWGAKVEARRRREGVYPPKEIYTPTAEDSQVCFNIYTADAERRMEHDENFPNEPRQIRGGENVARVKDGDQVRIQVSGQTAVMSINGLLTKVIFDHNPTNEFFVEESFPLDWMYPYLTPFGIIMKLNRLPLPEVTDDIVKRDHDFWSRYSERLIGNWITYETSVKEVCDFAENIYLRHDFSGFKGDRRFARDDQGQKAFSKLRSSIGGIYAWRVGMAAGSPTPPQYLPKTEAERQRMLKEAEFAFKQAFAFCPYSPEAVYRYVNLLASSGRMNDAILIAETCRKLDPFNPQIVGLVQQLSVYKSKPDVVTQLQADAARLETELRANSNDFQNAFELVQKYVALQQTDRAMLVLDGILNNPQAPPNVVASVVQAYTQLNNFQKLEPAVDRLVKIAPDDPQIWYVIADAYARMRNIAKLEPTLEKLVKLVPDVPEAWYNLAATKASLGKPPEAIQALRRSLELSAKRLATNANERNLRTEAERDPRFSALRTMPEYKALFAR